MKSIHEEGIKHIDLEAEAKERQKHTKYRWYWIPGGWKRALIAVGLLLGAAFLEKRIPTALFWVMIAGGIAMLIYGYIATAAYKKMKDWELSENMELLNQLDDDWVSDERKDEIRAELRKRGLKI